jgi:elongation factor P
VVDAQFIQMQACKPTMKTKIKNLISGKVLEVSFHAGDKVETADLLRKKVDYLYNDGSNYHFMTTDDFEQFELSKEAVGELAGYMKDGDKVDALYFNGNPVAINLPTKVELKVASAPEGVKGNSAQGRVTKAAEMETGITIQVPLFIKEGEMIKVNTETGEYSERA